MTLQLGQLVDKGLERQGNTCLCLISSEKEYDMTLGEMARATSRWLGVTAAGVGNLGRQRNGKLGGCYEGRNCYWRWDVITAQHQPLKEVSSVALAGWGVSLNKMEVESG